MANSIDKHEYQMGVDPEGIPTTYLCFNLLKTMFKEHNSFFSIDTLRALHAAKEKDVELICHSLCEQDLISQNPNLPDEFQYNIHSSRDDLQCNFEKYLAEVEIELIPVHEFLPYNPSSL
jgi:hypothetical protein